MNLLLITQEYPPETAHGGIATQSHRKAHGLAALGHSVTVLSHAGPHGACEVMDGAVRVRRIPKPDLRRPIRTDVARWLFWSGDVAEALESMMGEQPFDLVEFVEWGGEGFHWFLNRLGRRSPPAVVHVQGPLALLVRALGWPEPGSDLQRAGMFMEETCLRHADAVFSSSAFSARVCAETYGLDVSSIPVVHAGIDLDAFRPAAVARPAAPVVLFVGRISSSKGADLLVDAVLRIAGQFPDLRLRLIGRDDTGLGAALVGRAETAGFPNLLELPGVVVNSALPGEFAAATVFAAPSPCEGGPSFVHLEAMASGLPVIGCGGTGVTEVIEDGRTGFLVPIGDASALARALELLLREPQRRRQMGTAARAAIVERADSRLCVRRLAALYEDVMEGRLRSPAVPR